MTRFFNTTFYELCNFSMSFWYNCNTFVIILHVYWMTLMCIYILPFWIDSLHGTLTSRRVAQWRWLCFWDEKNVWAIQTNLAVRWRRLVYSLITIYYGVVFVVISPTCFGLQSPSWGRIQIWRNTFLCERSSYVYINTPAEIVGSNPTGAMDVGLLWVLCVVR